MPIRRFVISSKEAAVDVEHEEKISWHRAQSRVVSDLLCNALEDAGITPWPDLRPVHRAELLESGPQVHLGTCTGRTAQSLAKALSEYAALRRRLTATDTTGEDTHRLLAALGAQPVETEAGRIWLTAKEPAATDPRTA
jgi:hypothetical protein